MENIGIGKPAVTFYGQHSPIQTLMAVTACLPFRQALIPQWCYLGFISSPETPDYRGQRLKSKTSQSLDDLPPEPQLLNHSTALCSRSGCNSDR